MPSEFASDFAEKHLQTTATVHAARLTANLDQRQPTQRAIMACAEWLHYCLQIGWSKSDLDALEEVWWTYHDDYGRLIKSHA